MLGRLLYRDAWGAEASADLQAEGSFIGRAKDAAVRTDDAMVSRRNCRLWREGDSWLVEDLGSSNGTFVNDERVTRQALRHGDVIRCGTLQARFVEVAESGDPGGPGLSELEQARQDLAAREAEHEALERQLFDVQRELEQLRTQKETDQAELNRLRIDAVTYRDKANELGRVHQLTEEELNAQMRVGVELRRELEDKRKEHTELRDRFDKSEGDLAARERQLARSNEDLQRTKQTLDEVRGKVADLERTKDAGWRELNNRVAELDGLRAVIAEQERLLEERRVGLISLEATAQDLRADKEKLLRELVTARSEREEAKINLSSLRNQIEGLEEDHRRLQRAISDGSGGTADEALKLATDLRQSRVALKTLEAERERLNERAERADAARVESEQRLAKLDVERTQAVEEKQRAISARERAEEALSRAEGQRKSADDLRRNVEDADARLVTELGKVRGELDDERAALAEARKAVDEQRSGAEESRRSLQRARDAIATEIVARKKAEEALAAALAAHAADQSALPAPRPARGENRTMPMMAEGATGPMSAGMIDEPTLNGANGPSLHSDSELSALDDGGVRIAALEEELASLGSELAIARAELESAHKSNGAPPADAPGIGDKGREIQRRAEEAYHGVNDALSELRTNILLARRLVGELNADGEAARSLAAAIATSADRAEDAKGILRQLRDVVEA